MGSQMDAEPTATCWRCVRQSGHTQLAVRPYSCRRALPPVF